MTYLLLWKHLLPIVYLHFIFILFFFKQLAFSVRYKTSFICIYKSAPFDLKSWNLSILFLASPAKTLPRYEMKPETLKILTTPYIRTSIFVISTFYNKVNCEKWITVIQNKVKVSCCAWYLEAFTLIWTLSYFKRSGG